MCMTNKKNLLSSIFFMVFSIVMYIIGIPKGIKMQNFFGSSGSKINSRTFPYFVIVIVFIAALILFVETIIKIRKDKQSKTESIDEQKVEKITRKDVIRLLIIMGLFVGYVVLFNIVGVIIATIIIFPLVLWANGTKKISYYLYVYIFAIIIYCLFRFVLNINLP